MGWGVAWVTDREGKVREGGTGTSRGIGLLGRKEECEQHPERMNCGGGR